MSPRRIAVVCHPCRGLLREERCRRCYWQKGLEFTDKDYGQPAVLTAEKFGLWTELGRAPAFDIHVQNGSIKPAAEHDIAETLYDTPITTE